MRIYNGESKDLTKNELTNDFKHFVSFFFLCLTTAPHAFRKVGATILLGILSFSVTANAEPFLALVYVHGQSK